MHKEGCSAWKHRHQSAEELESHKFTLQFLTGRTAIYAAVVNR